MKRGIDISGWNVPPYKHYNFYIIKATEGADFKCDMLDTNYNYIADNYPSANYGFYHYARPDLGNRPETEAEWFLQTVGHHKGSAAFALDWEGEALNHNPEWALKWLKYVRDKMDAIPLFYCSSSPLQEENMKVIRESGFPLWVAHYGVSPGNPDMVDKTPWAIHQYKDSPLDMNVLSDYYKWEDFVTWKKNTSKPEIKDYKDYTIRAHSDKRLEIL